jgi:hypothetical protein
MVGKRLWIQKFESFRSSQAVKSWGCHFRVEANRRHFRWLGWRAPVSACYFPISVSASRRPVRFFMETGSDGAHLEACQCVRGFRLHRAPITMDIRDRRSYRTCRLIWAERIGEPSHGSHALL